MKKFCLAIFLIPIFMVGCARTVTTVGRVGTQITIQVSFAADIQPENRVFILFGTNNSAPNVPFLPFELVQPGEAILNTQVDYYTDFYSTWTDYALIQGQVAQLVPGPFTSTGTPEASQLFEFTQTASNTFSLTYALTRMSFGTTIPEKLYMDIVTVGNNNIVVDNLSFNFPTGTLSTLQVRTDPGTSVTLADTDSTGAITDASLDIQNYTITIQ